MELQTVEYVPFAPIFNHNIQNPVTLSNEATCRSACPMESPKVTAVFGFGPGFGHFK